MAFFTLSDVFRVLSTSSIFTSWAIFCRKLTAFAALASGQRLDDIGTITYRFRKPSLASEFEPAEVAAHAGRTKDGVGILLELFVRNRFIDGNLDMVSWYATRRAWMVTYGVILSMDREERDLYVEEGICRGGISVVGPLRRVTP